MHITHLACRRFSRNLQLTVFANRARRSHRAGSTLPGDTQSRRPDSVWTKLHQAIRYEEEHKFVNVQGTTSDFARALANYLDVAQDLLPQHLAKAKVLDTYRENVEKYGEWSSDERRDYLQPLLGVVNNFSRVSRDGRPHRRAHPVPMQVQSTAPRSGLTQHDVLFSANSKLKTGPQAPPGRPRGNPTPQSHAAMPVHPQPLADTQHISGGVQEEHDASSSSRRSVLQRTNGGSSNGSAMPHDSFAEGDTEGMQQLHGTSNSIVTTTNHHDTRISSHGALYQQEDASQRTQLLSRSGHSQTAPAPSPTELQPASQAQRWSPQTHTGLSEPFDQRALQTALPRQLELSDAVQEFLGSPVTGPHRPIIFDLETTGRCTPANRIIELAVIGGHSGRVYSNLVNTENVSSCPEAFMAHGIRDEESWHPSTPGFGQVMSGMLEFIREECSGPEGGTPVLIAHNGKIFDYKFLDQECKRWNFQLPREWQWMDSLLLAKHCVKDTPEVKARRSLQALRERFGIAPNQAHRALADCEILLAILPHLLKLNDTPDLAQLMRQDSKCSGTLGDVLGPAPRQRALEAAKLKTTELTTALLVHDEEEACSSEPDPASSGGLAVPLASKTSLAEAKQVKVNWRHGVVDNEQLSRELLDSPPDRVKKALTPGQQKKVMAAGFETFWELLQYYPKDYTLFQTHLQRDRHVMVQGTVTKSTAGGPGFNLELRVDAAHNPLLHPPDNTPFPGTPDDPSHDSEGSLQEDSEYSSATDDEAELFPESHLDSDSGLNEHGRSISPEEASTSTYSPPSLPPNHPQHDVHPPPPRGAQPEQLQGQQTVEVKKFFAGRMGNFGARNLASQFPVGSQVMVQGKVTVGSKPGTWVTTNAVLALATGTGSASTPQLVARYAAHTPVKDKDFPAIIDRALKAVQESSTLQSYDVVPSMLTDQYDLTGWFQALRAIHQPRDAADLEAAKRRLAFEELLLLQLKLLLRREIDRTPRSPVDLVGTRVEQLDMMEAGREALGFRLTAAQERVLAEVVRDMEGPAPMMRLLQGDVGSGKTAVAMLALLAAAGSGWQGAFMVPTEVLAEQHMMKLEQLVRALPLKQRPRVAILTGSARAKEKRAVYASLADGSTDIVVGTHSLITDALEFKRLGLAVIDEQHRFGVNQRAKLQNKNSPLPHVLSMTATPIPRTLALTTHGDMALSAIDELPPGRQPVLTHAALDTPANRAKMYAVIREELEAGGRAYIICPLVGESASEVMAGIKAAEEEHRHLQESGVLGSAACGLLHGRMSSEDKFAALQAFATGVTPILVSTTVVEVGVDVPEASVIIVEHSERFGLAQLHQLRGRVGRGTRASTCYLMTPNKRSLARLQVLTQSQNGFTIAEADLLERGPGDFLGKKQSGRDGLSCLKAARLPEDRQLLEQARAAAAELLQEYGLEPSGWPQDLLAALKDKNLPDLDLSEVSQLTWGGDKGIEAAMAASK